ncbi:hypothetical protein O9992_17525 [Vibrio lentus]|nr:hypothetical protein [Vibrio lentus]
MWFGVEKPVAKLLFRLCLPGRYIDEYSVRLFCRAASYGVALPTQLGGCWDFIESINTLNTLEEDVLRSLFVASAHLSYLAQHLPQDVKS